MKRTESRRHASEPMLVSYKTFPETIIESKDEMKRVEPRPVSVHIKPLPLIVTENRDEARRSEAEPVVTHDEPFLLHAKITNQGKTKRQITDKMPAKMRYLPPYRGSHIPEPIYINDVMPKLHKSISDDGNGK